MKVMLNRLMLCDVIVLLDINECDEDANLCQMNGNCVNVPGSFRCFCPDGYSVANRGKMCVGKLRDKIETNTSFIQRLLVTDNDVE